MKLQRKLMSSYIILVTLAALFVALPVLVSLQRTLKDSAINTAKLQMTNAKTGVNGYLETPLTTLKSAMNYMSLDENKDRNSVESFFAMATKDEPSYLMLYFATIKSLLKGGYLYSDAHWNPPEGWDFSTRDWYKIALQSYTPCFSDVYIDDHTKQSVVTISQCYTVNGAIRGVVALDMNLDKVVDMVNQVKLSKSGKSFMINKDGYYVINEDPSKVGKANFFDEYGYANHKDDVLHRIEAIDLNSDNNYFVCCPMNELCGWNLVTVGPKSELFADAANAKSLIFGQVILAIIIVIVLSFVITYSIIKPIKAIGRSLTEMAGGNADLTKRLNIKSNDEVGVVSKGFDGFMSKLNEIMKLLKSSKDALSVTGEDLNASTEDTENSIKEIIQNISGMQTQIGKQENLVQNTAGSVNNISSSIDSLDNLIQSQAAGVSQASAAVEEMIGNIGSVNTSVEKMASQFTQLQSDAQNGSNKQNDVNNKIAQIEDQSKTLQEANAAISSIAGQTNLLAMNAAIEAAHAGEAGKGFAVVADEIRKLSETSTTQSKTIGEQLRLIQESINSVVGASKESSEAFKAVSSRIVETDQIVKQIKAAMEEQQEGSKQITEVLHSMNDSTIEVKSSSDKMSQESKNVLSEINELLSATSEMMNTMENMSGSATKIKETGKALSGINESMDDAIDDIGKQIDQFKCE